MKKVKKLAIANRGEVAVRIIHACQELGIQTLLLHSEADQWTRAYRMADETYCLGGSSSGESYLNIEKNIVGAKSMGADAIHPGFGFLSENADFAQACIDANLVFVGPSPDAIRRLGDKIEAKKIIAKAKVPTIPGYMDEDQTIDVLVKKAKEIGLPVIVKAAAGGGGRGMKVIRTVEEADELIGSAQREALSAFGSAKVFLEKYLDRAKHIEFQVFGDFTGNCVSLFERECTVQRRHQKIVEEALSPSLSEDLRQEMSKAAVSLAREVGYQGAGTVEFLVQDEKFYFLEMNTRLQVEHPVTEMVLGVDLVKAQIMTAFKEWCLWPTEKLVPRGHAIECRIYAENPYQGGIPSTGKIVGLKLPEGPGRRFEIGIEIGDEVTPFYDPMIAKAIVWDEDRTRAIEKMIFVLSETVIFGVYTNIPYLKEILQHPEFVSGTMTTQFIQTYFPDGLKAKELTQLQKSISKEVLSAATRKGMGLNEGSISATTKAPAVSLLNSPWMSGWRGI